MDAGTFESARRETHPANRFGGLVLLSGIGTSLATLALLLALNAALPALALMNWHANYVVPLGAILVGLAAGSGYGIACWLKRARLGKRLMFGILLLQAVCFFGSHYVEYAMIRNVLLLADPLSFWQYFDWWARGFSFDTAIHAGPQLGAWGYAMRAVEFACFSLCGIVVMAMPFARRGRAAMPTA